MSHDMKMRSSILSQILLSHLSLPLAELFFTQEVQPTLKWRDKKVLLIHALQWSKKMANGDEVETSWNKVFGSWCRFGRMSAYYFRRWALLVSLADLDLELWNPKVTLMSVCQKFHNQWGASCVVGPTTKCKMTEEEEEDEEGDIILSPCACKKKGTK